jgi:hypothetical protein
MNLKTPSGSSAAGQKPWPHNGIGKSAEGFWKVSTRHGCALQETLLFVDHKKNGGPKAAAVDCREKPEFP